MEGHSPGSFGVYLVIGLSRLAYVISTSRLQGSYLCLDSTVTCEDTILTEYKKVEVVLVKLEITLISRLYIFALKDGMGHVLRFHQSPIPPRLL
jgi:hypothetical protein